METGFKSLRPTLPRNANVYAATQATGTQSVYIHVNRYQPLRIWYRDPTVLTLNPRERVATRGQEFLFWISPSLEVFEIDLSRLQPRSSGSKPQLSEYQITLRVYARGLADAGEVSRAVQILTTMPEATEMDRSFDYRQAAMILFMARRDSEALRLLAMALPIDSVQAAPVVADLLLDRSSKNMDAAALRAFGIRSTLPEVYRMYMRFFETYQFPDPEREFARKLQAVAPGDLESAEILRRLGTGPAADRVTTPVERGSR